MDTARWSAYGIAYAAVIAFTCILIILSIPFGVYAVFFTQLSTTYTYQTLVAYLPLYIGPLTVTIPVTPTFGAVFIGLTLLYAFFIVLALVQGVGFARVLKSTAKEGLGATFRNPLSAMILLLGASLLATVILEYFQTTAGVGTGGLSERDPFLLFMDFTISPLIEEIGYRFFLIGVPLFVLLLAARLPLKKMLRALWRPSAAWEAHDNPDPEDTLVPHDTLRSFAYFLIAFSSVLFGLAHYYSGAGWGPGKVGEAAVDGVAMGYLYVRYGLHASILYHWVVDYSSNAFAFFGQGVYGINWASNSVFSLVPTYDILYLVGIPGFLYLANVFLKRVIRPPARTTADDSSRQVNTD